jgi:phosphotransferase system HPr (HPr) family protein
MPASCEQVITLAGDLHARPAGALAVAAGRFAAAVSVTAGGHTADAKSVLGVMSLGATSGQHVTVSAAGPDAREAVATLITILSQATKVGGLLNAAQRTGKARARKCQVADEWRRRRDRRQLGHGQRRRLRRWRAVGGDLRRPGGPRGRGVTLTIRDP